MLGQPVDRGLQSFLNSIRAKDSVKFRPKASVSNALCLSSKAWSSGWVVSMFLMWNNFILSSFGAVGWAPWFKGFVLYSFAPLTWVELIWRFVARTLHLWAWRWLPCPIQTLRIAHLLWLSLGRVMNTWTALLRVTHDLGFDVILLLHLVHPRTLSCVSLTVSHRLAKQHTLLRERPLLFVRRLSCILRFLVPRVSACMGLISSYFPSGTIV